MGNLISSLMQSTYNGLIRFTCYEIAFRRNFTCRAGIKNAFGHSKSIPRWEWTRLLPYLFSAVLLVLLSACPVADWLNLPSMLTLNTGIKHPPALSLCRFLLSCLRFILFISLPECRLRHMVPRLRSLRNFCAWLRSKLSFLCGIYFVYLVYLI